MNSSSSGWPKVAFDDLKTGFRRAQDIFSIRDTARRGAMRWKNRPLRVSGIRFSHSMQVL
jgi:hypothetical protein